MDKNSKKMMSKLNWIPEMASPRAPVLRMFFWAVDGMWK